MTKNPLINALSASLYIGAVVCVLFFGPAFVGTKETLLIPIVMLSLFSLSVVMMAYIFFFNPVMMYIEGKKKEAIALGMQTVGIFAVITLILLATLVLTASA